MAKDNKIATYVEGGKTRTGIFTDRALVTLADQGRLKKVHRFRDRMDEVLPGGAIENRCR